MITRLWRSLLIAPLALVGIAGAAGYSIYEQGGSAHAQAGAFAARASDPSAIFFNPAGIATQNAAVSVGTALILPSSEYISPAGDKESMKSQLFYPSHVYAVYPVSEVTLGFGFFTPFGLGTEWEDDFSGRFISKKAEIQSFYLNPVVAYNWNDFSFAAGLQAVHANVEMTRVQQQVIPGLGLTDVADIAMDGSNSINWGWNVGVRWAPDEKLAVGISFRSEVTASMEGTAKFEGMAVQGGQLPPEADVLTDIPFPSILSVGVAYQVLPKLAVEVNVLSMQWSIFETLAVEFPDYPALNEAHAELYEDARSYRIGAEYNLNEKIDLRAGFLYDESPVPTASLSPMLPCADRWSIMAGVGYDVGPVVLDLGYMFLQFKDRTSQHPYFPGTYKSTAHLIGLTATYAF